MHRPETHGQTQNIHVFIAAHGNSEVVQALLEAARHHFETEARRKVHKRAEGKLQSYMDSQNAAGETALMLACKEG